MLMVFKFSNGVTLEDHIQATGKLSMFVKEFLQKSIAFTHGIFSVNSIKAISFRLVERLYFGCRIMCLTSDLESPKLTKSAGFLKIIRF